MSQPWIGVDLDGTLAEYHGWISEEHIGEPIPLMVEHVRGMLAAGHKVKIFTARVADNDPCVRQVIEIWCLEHLGHIFEITNVKDMAMLCLYDDRCIQVERNTGRLILYQRAINDQAVGKASEAAWGANG